MRTPLLDDPSHKHDEAFFTGAGSSDKSVRTTGSAFSGWLCPGYGADAQLCCLLSCDADSEQPSSRGTYLEQSSRCAQQQRQQQRGIQSALDHEFCQSVNRGEAENPQPKSVVSLSFIRTLERSVVKILIIVIRMRYQ